MVWYIIIDGTWYQMRDEVHAVQALAWCLDNGYVEGENVSLEVLHD